jgi:hypothetical protein
MYRPVSKDNCRSTRARSSSARRLCGAKVYQYSMSLMVTDSQSICFRSCKVADFSGLSGWWF